MYANTSSEIEIPKINKTKFTRYYLTLLSADKYRKDITKMIKCNRFMTAKSATIDEIIATDLLIENHIQRFSIKSIQRWKKKMEFVKE